MIADEIRYTMKYIEEASQNLGHALAPGSYYIEDAGRPHKQPALPKGWAAVYIFAYESEDGYECLKIGKANANSAPRFTSQHYGFSAPSTLAKYICADNQFRQMGISPETVKPWMLHNLRRINIYIRADQGRAATELVETMLHYRFRPRYEGGI